MPYEFYSKLFFWLTSSDLPIDDRGRRVINHCLNSMQLQQRSDDMEEVSEEIGCTETEELPVDVDLNAEETQSVTITNVRSQPYTRPLSKFDKIELANKVFSLLNSFCVVSAYSFGRGLDFIFS